MAPEKIGRRTFLQEVIVATIGIPIPAIHEETEGLSFWYGRVKVEILSVHSGPGTFHPEVGFLREGQIVTLEPKIVKDNRGFPWAKIIQNSSLCYPPKTGEWLWYEGLEIIEEKDLTPIHRGVNPAKKLILISLKEQMLVAYEEGREVFRTLVSTGKKSYETPTGIFSVIYKRLERRMQGADYDTPGVPYCLFFTKRGHAIHGANWHHNFGSPVSHGCINLPLDSKEDIGMSPAEWLFRWSTPIFTLSDIVVRSTPNNPGTTIKIEYNPTFSLKPQSISLQIPGRLPDLAR